MRDLTSSTPGISLPTVHTIRFKSDAMAKTTSKDYYKVLGLGRQVHLHEIKDAYHKLALQRHPDKNLGNPSAVTDFQILNEAYETLANEHRRLLYDERFRKTNRHAAFDEEFEAWKRSPERQNAARQWANEIHEQAARKQRAKDEEERKATESTAQWLALAGAAIAKRIKLKARIRGLEAGLRALEDQNRDLLEAEARARDQAGTHSSTILLQKLEKEIAIEQDIRLESLISERANLYGLKWYLEALQRDYERDMGQRGKYWQGYAREWEIQMAMSMGFKE